MQCENFGIKINYLSIWPQKIVEKWNLKHTGASKHEITTDKFYKTCRNSILWELTKMFRELKKTA